MANYINPEQIVDGMLLAEPIINKFGNTLLPSGAELRTSHINLLKTWNIKVVCVKGDEIEENNEITEEQRALAIERLKGRMLWVPRNDLEKDLYNMGILVAVKLNNSGDYRIKD